MREHRLHHPHGAHDVRVERRSPRVVVDGAQRAVPAERHSGVVEHDVDLLRDAVHLLDAIEVLEVLVQVSERSGIGHVQRDELVGDVVDGEASQEVHRFVRISRARDDVTAAAVVAAPDPQQVLLDQLEPDAPAGAGDEHAERLIALLRHDHRGWWMPREWILARL